MKLDKFLDKYNPRNDIFKKYPELDKIAKDLAYDIGQDINKRIKNVKSDMPYKAQYVLEELIKHLQDAV